MSWELCPGILLTLIPLVYVTVVLLILETIFGVSVQANKQAIPKKIDISRTPPNAINRALPVLWPCSTYSIHP